VTTYACAFVRLCVRVCVANLTASPIFLFFKKIGQQFDWGPHDETVIYRYKFANVGSL